MSSRWFKGQKKKVRSQTRRTLSPTITQWKNDSCVSDSEVML